MEDWVRLPDVELPNCTVYVKPTSYMLLDPEEREKKWIDDCKNNRYPASVWLETMKEVRRRQVVSGKQRQ